MNATAIIAAIGLAGLVAFAIWIWSLIDVLKRPDTQWENAGQNKTIWVIVLVALGPLGTILYLLTARATLKRFQYKAAPTNFDPTNFGVPEGGIAYQGDGFHPANR